MLSRSARSARSARPRAARWSLALDEATRLKRMLGMDTHMCGGSVGRVPGQVSVDACFNSVVDCWRQM